MSSSVLVFRVCRGASVMLMDGPGLQPSREDLLQCLTHSPFPKPLRTPVFLGAQLSAGFTAVCCQRPVSVPAWCGLQRMISRTSAARSRWPSERGGG